MTSGSSKKASQSAALRNRLSTWAAGLLLAAALAAGLVAPFLAIHQARQPFPGFFVEPNLVLIKMERPDWGGRLAQELLVQEPGAWHVEAVDGAGVQRAPDLYDALKGKQPGDLVNYSLAPFPTTEAVREVAIPLARFSASDMLLLFWGPYFVALAYLVCGLWVFRARRDTAAGRSCAIACAAAALGLSLAFDALWGQHLYRLWAVGLPLVAAGTMHMALVFPEPLPPARRAPALAFVPYALAAGLIAWGQTLETFATPSLGDYLPFWKPTFVLIGLAVLLLLGSFLYTLRAGSTALVRRQARSVLGGGIAAFVPAAAGIGAILAQLDPASFFPLIYLALAAFPLTLVLTIARRRLFAMERSLQRGLTNSLLTVVLAGLYIVLVYFLGQWSAWLVQPGDPLTLAFLVLLAAFLISPGQRYLGRLLDHLLHRDSVSFQKAVQDFAYSLAQVIELGELSGLILRRVARALELDAASLYLFDPSSGTYTLYEALGAIETKNAPVFAETDGFIQLLRVSRHVIQRSPENDDPFSALSEEEMARVDRLRAAHFLPLSTKNRLVGWLNLGPRKSGEWYTAEDAELLDAFADRAAMAIENARLFAERNRRLTELAALNEIGAAINSARSLEETLETIYRETGRLMDATNLYIALYDPEKEEVSFPLNMERGQRRAVASRRFGNGLTEHILHTQQPLLIAERVEEKVRSLGLDLIGEVPSSWLGVPIRHEGQTRGVIAVQSDDPNTPYDVEDLNILTAIANQAAIAIENARLYESTDQALARRLEEITVLSDFSRTLAAVALNPAQVAEQTLSRAIDTFQAQAGALVHYDENQQSFVLLAQVNWHDSPSWQDTWHALLPNLLVTAPNPLVYHSFTNAPAAGPPAQLLCPLIREDTPLGILHLILPEGADPDTERLRFLRYLADHAAIALENALLYQTQVQQGQVLDRRARHLAEILHLSNALRANMDLEQVLQFVLRAVRDTLGFEIVLISLVDEKDPTRLRRAIASGIEPETFRRLQAERLPLSVYEQMLRPELRIGHSYRIGPQDAAVWENMRHIPGPYVLVPPLHSQAGWDELGWLLTPLRGTADRLLGVLTVSRPPDKGWDDLDKIEILEIIANQAAVAIENARLYQALRQAYETKGEFLSLVAHELQVPMGTLWGYAELLDSEIAKVDIGTLRGFIQVLKTNIGRLDALIRDMLEISRAEAGALSLERVPLDMGEAVLESVATFRPQIERKGLRLIVDAPLGLSPVLADRDRMVQVLDNLLSNALKYTPTPGEIAITASVVHSVEEWGAAKPWPAAVRCPCVLVTVRDTGIGIPRAEQKNVFARFFRSDHPVVRQEAGTGLGLYLVRLLVEGQGGHVWMESEPGQGSKFFVALPLAET